VWGVVYLFRASLRFAKKVNVKRYGFVSSRRNVFQNQ
jgi:hypothetical protein